jgi:hypothetical protein
MTKNHIKLNVTISRDIYEAIDREKRRQSRSAFVNDILWCALIATTEELRAINNYAEVITAEQ